jgi:hypothetical protein
MAAQVKIVFGIQPFGDANQRTLGALGSVCAGQFVLAPYRLVSEMG